MQIERSPRKQIGTKHSQAGYDGSHCVGQELSTREPMPVLDAQTPRKLSSLPPWVGALLGHLRKEHQPDKTGRYREVMTLPEGMVLTGEQKTLVERHIQTLVPFFDMTPENDPSHAQTTLVAVSKMLMTLAGRDAGDFAGEARGEAYMAALEDMPCWAVQEAARKWYRGEYGSKHDYKWMPAPSTLRELASTEELRVRATVRGLRDLISAETLIEYSDEHRERMKSKVMELSKALKKSCPHGFNKPGYCSECNFD